MELKIKAQKESLFSLWETLQSSVALEMQEIDRLIQSRIQESIPLMIKIGDYILEAGGKRVRPMLMLLSSKLVGYKGFRHMHIACAVELIHTATLLHDDVVDESCERRGNPTAHRVWGNKMAILAGDLLFSRAFECIVEDGSCAILRVLSSASSFMAEGEMLQLESLQDLDLEEEEYYKIIEAKTGALFEASSRIGAILGNVSPEEEEDLARFGKILGMLFQITDDLLDYKDGSYARKEIGRDFREGKVTLPSLFAYQCAGKEERDFWQRTFREKKQTSQDFAQAQMYLVRHGIFEKIQENLLRKGEECKKSLDIFPKSEEKTLLLNLVDFILERTF